MLCFKEGRITFKCQISICSFSYCWICNLVCVCCNVYFMSASERTGLQALVYFRDVKFWKSQLCITEAMDERMIHAHQIPGRCNISTSKNQEICFRIYGKCWCGRDKETSHSCAVSRCLSVDQGCDTNHCWVHYCSCTVCGRAGAFKSKRQKKAIRFLLLTLFFPFNSGLGRVSPYFFSAA